MKQNIKYLPKWKLASFLNGMEEMFKPVKPGNKVGFYLAKGLL
jgi:hypothetical protein